MFLQRLYAALLSWRNSHVGSTWSWYIMWSGEIFFRSLERSNFRSVWPSSVHGDLRDCNNLPIAIYAIVLFCRLRFMRSCYFANRDSRDRVISSIVIYVIVLFLVGPRFEPRPNSMIFFIGPGFDSPARLPVSGQCDSWPMSGPVSDANFNPWSNNSKKGIGSGHLWIPNMRQNDAGSKYLSNN